MNPTVTIDITDTDLNDTDSSSVVTFTFSEAPVNFDASDITSVGGAITGLAVTADPLVYTATFTATDGFDGTGSVTIDAAKFTDAATNDNLAAIPDTVVIDTLNPTVRAVLAATKQPAVWPEARTGARPQSQAEPPAEPQPLSTSNSSRVLIYVQHLLGVGHLQRAIHLSSALLRQGFRVDLVSGSPQFVFVSIDDGVGVRMAELVHDGS